MSPPAQFARIQLLLRVVLAVVLGWFGITAGWLIGVLYGALPLIAAIAISSNGSERYAREVAPRVWRVLAWLLQLSAYMALVTDRFPTGDREEVTFDLRFAGRPTVGAALLRLITSIPSGIVLMLLWCVASVLWCVAAVVVLVGRAMPRSILGFQCGVLRWQAGLVAYHASLVDAYPAFALDTRLEDPALAAAGAR